MGLLDLAADLVAIASASRSVAAKHAALRTRQLGAAMASAAPEKPKSPIEADEHTPQGESTTPETPTASAPPTPAQPHRSPQQDADTDPTEDIANKVVPNEVVLPSFVHRTQARPMAPPSIRRGLCELQVQGVVGPEAQAGSGPSLPHPLDPRFQTKRPIPPAPGPKPQSPPETVPLRIRDAVLADAFRDTSAEVMEDAERSREGTQSRTSLSTEDLASKDASADTEEGRMEPTATTIAKPETHTEAELDATNDEPNDAKTDETPSELVKEQPKPFADQLFPGQLPADQRPVAPPKRQLRESKVPATRLSRMWNYGGLAAGVLGGALTESISRGFGGGSTQGGSVMLSAGNLERLVARLSRMRGAALKLGQMMSFQDSKMLPPALQQVLQRVQDGADYMPAWQRDQVLAANLGGADWRDLFSAFDETPLAAASIGQVHRAMLRSNGARVAVKIQFPGVADSIRSDLDNLGLLLTATRMLPRGLYLDKTIANAREELAWECDYEREAACTQRFETLLAAAGETGPGGVFAVPTVFPEASGKQVLTMSFMDGIGVTRIMEELSQEQRDWIGTQILRLCLLEITQFRFMQTDPNWTNFLFNARTQLLELLDFGASREFPAAFVDQYMRLLRAAAQTDREAIVALSRQLGYLTGHESRAMLDTHTQSILTLAEPFRATSPAIYDFHDQTITDRVRSFIPVMVRERLTPPPEETYSLHRKLSGAFLLCARLGSRVPCRALFDDSLAKMDLA